MAKKPIKITGLDPDPVNVLIDGGIPEPAVISIRISDDYEVDISKLEACILDRAKKDCDQDVEVCIVNATESDITVTIKTDRSARKEKRKKKKEEEEEEKKDERDVAVLLDGKMLDHRPGINLVG